MDGRAELCDNKGCNKVLGLAFVEQVNGTAKNFRPVFLLDNSEKHTQSAVVVTQKRDIGFFNCGSLIHCFALEILHANPAQFPGVQHFPLTSTRNRFLRM
jgi:hypothetical protein